MKEYIWQEDDCTRGLPGHVGIRDVIVKHTGMTLDEFQANSTTRDHGDMTEWVHKDLSLVVGFSFDGWFIRKTEIEKN